MVKFIALLCFEESWSTIWMHNSTMCTLEELDNRCVLLNVVDDTYENVQVAKWLKEVPCGYCIKYLYTCTIDGNVQVDCAVDGIPKGILYLKILDISPSATTEQLERFIVHVRKCIMDRYDVTEDTKSFIMVTDIDRNQPRHVRALLGFGCPSRDCTMATERLGFVQTRHDERKTFPVSAYYEQPDVFKYGIGLRCHVEMVYGMKTIVRVHYNVPVWVMETSSELFVMFARPLIDEMDIDGAGDIYFHVAEAQSGNSLIFEKGETDDFGPEYYNWPRWNKLYAMTSDESVIRKNIRTSGSKTIVFTQFSLLKWEDDCVPKDVDVFRCHHMYKRQHQQLLHMARYILIKTNHAARVIQRVWRSAVVCPEHKVCRNRLMREFKELQ